MLDSVSQLGGAAAPRSPIFARYPLSQLLARQADGYAWAKGVHLYSELRPVSVLQIADTDESAKKYLGIIEEYAHAGVVAARLFGFELLEFQGNVLHFHKDGDDFVDIALAALRFAHVFTKVLYETLADDLGDQWRGFAMCMDHGESIIVRRGQASNSSAISLGPAANRPAKRLLYGRTPAGHAEIPGNWAAKVLGIPAKEEWFAINLRDRDSLPNSHSVQSAELENQFRRAMSDYRSKRSILMTRSQPFALANASDLIERGSFSTDRPLRMLAHCMRVDLDRFTPIVEEAFRRGEQAVEDIAKGFIKILEFGDFFEKKHYGVIRFPWAGDCVSFLIPSQGDVATFRGQGWISFVEEWQAFASGTEQGRRDRWAETFSGVLWAVGITYADTGLCLVAPVSTESRKFLVGAGAPISLAHEAQNLGKGGETVIHNADYEAAYPVVRSLFAKISNTEFWKGKDISTKKVQEAAIRAGKSENASKIQIVSKAATVTLPPPRPYCP